MVKTNCVLKRREDGSLSFVVKGCQIRLVGMKNLEKDADEGCYAGYRAEYEHLEEVWTLNAAQAQSGPKFCQGGMKKLDNIIIKISNE